MAERLLIVEDEDTLRESLTRVFLREGYEVESFPDAEAALDYMKNESCDLILTDIILPGMDGIELLKRCREVSAEQLIVVMTAFASLETAVDALRSGAYDYIIKPVLHEEIKRIVRNALKERALRAENSMLKKQIGQRYDFDHIIGKSAAIQSLLEEVKKIAESKSTILLLGDTGTGKELFARSIHYNSGRKEKPFIPINCSAIPDSLLESELFGYIRGAFTGAVSNKRGLFEEADGGTLFLDEIGELSMQLQAKLLRVIDDREIRPLGGVQARKVDVRIVTATNRDLAKAVGEGAFREDLYYRINVIRLELPSLRERRDDIDLLARHFVHKYSGEFGKAVRTIDGAAAQLLMAYDWPGNVRELQNIVERAVLLADGEVLLPEHLPEGVRAGGVMAAESLMRALSIEDYTKEFISVYQQKYTEQQLADKLGITRKSLWEKRKRYGLQKKQN